MLRSVLFSLNKWNSLNLNCHLVQHFWTLFTLWDQPANSPCAIRISWNQVLIRLPCEAVPSKTPTVLNNVQQLLCLALIASPCLCRTPLRYPIPLIFLPTFPVPKPIYSPSTKSLHFLTYQLMTQRSRYVISLHRQFTRYQVRPRGIRRFSRYRLRSRGIR